MKRRTDMVLILIIVTLILIIGLMKVDHAKDTRVQKTHHQADCRGSQEYLLKSLRGIEETLVLEAEERCDLFVGSLYRRLIAFEEAQGL